jgi:hypothetical protein
MPSPGRSADNFYLRDRNIRSVWLWIFKEMNNSDRQLKLL